MELRLRRQHDGAEDLIFLAARICAMRCEFYPKDIQKKKNRRKKTTCDMPNDIRKYRVTRLYIANVNMARAHTVSMLLV